MLEYKSLEQAIVELWASRQVEVLEEKVEVLKNGNVKWTIIGKRKKLKVDKNNSKQIHA